MLEKLLSPLTTATAGGTTLRYILVIFSSMMTLLGGLQVLTPAQVDVLSRTVPEILGALFALITIVIPAYAAWTKSSSDRAAEVAKQIDKVLPPNATAKVKTPDGIPDIPVPAETR
jgi:hypothetical protein